MLNVPFFDTADSESFMPEFAAGTDGMDFLFSKYGDSDRTLRFF